MSVRFPRPLGAKHLDTLVAYVPGKPISETQREYGVTDIAKLASNENCLGMSPKARAALTQAATEVHLYPDAGGFHLRARLAAFHDVTPNMIALGNGTNELIVLLVRALIDVSADDAMVTAWPSFVAYRIAARAQGATEIAVPLTADLGYDLVAMARAANDPRVKLVFLANPNNPTGRAFAQGELDQFLAAIPDDVVVVLDEAYAEYVRDPAYPNGVAVVKRRPRTVVLRTFSKAYGLAGLRIGYSVSDPAIADLLNKMRDAFNTNNIAQAAALAALDDPSHVVRCVEHNARALPRLAAALMDRGMEVATSHGNFVLVSVPAHIYADVAALNVELLKRGLIVRPLANYELPRALRITVGTDAENGRLLAALDDIFQRDVATRPFVVALDGPAGAGKSTVAKRLAQLADLSLVDTGAIYRCVAWVALKRGVSLDDGVALGAIASDLSRKLRFEMRDGSNCVLLDGDDVSAAIRTPDVSTAASAVSRHPDVRDALLGLQRALGSTSASGTVLEGRDIGTVVFPNARIKVFVTATPRERALRRQKELADKGTAEPFDKVFAELLARDTQDTQRAVAPLKPAPDAYFVDTTDKTQDEVVAELLTLVQGAR